MAITMSSNTNDNPNVETDCGQDAYEFTKEASEEVKTFDTEERVADPNGETAEEVEGSTLISTDELLVEPVSGPQITVETYTPPDIEGIIAESTDLTDDNQSIYRLCIRKCDDEGIHYTEKDAKDLLDIVTNLMSHCRMELLRDRSDLKSVEGMSDLVDGMKEQYKSSEATYKAIEALASGDIFDDNPKPDEQGEVKEESHALGKFAKKSIDDASEKPMTPEELDATVDKLKKDIQMSKIAYDVVYQWYNETHPEPNIYDDILEKLNKDLDTLKASSDINAPRRIKAINDAIDSIVNRDIEFLFDALYNKTNNPKALRNLAKEAIKYSGDVYHKLTKLGFTMNDLQTFISFFAVENKFRSIYNTGDRYIETAPIAEKTEKDIDTALSKEIANTCFFFFYHLIKIIEAEKKREYYTTIKYRLGILLVCETVLNYPSVATKFRERFSEPITEEPVTETEASLARSKLYDRYMPLLQRYHDTLNDKSLMKYANDWARKFNR